MSDGWIKTYRKILDWPWFSNPMIAHFWEYCRVKANHASGDIIVGVVPVHLEPGQFVFGRSQASKETGISQQSLRTCLSKLELSGCLKSTIHPTKHFSIITICNWETYQGGFDSTNQPINQAPTKRQPSANQAPTTNKNDKNEKKNKNEKKEQHPAGKTTLPAEPPLTSEPELTPKPSRKPDQHAEAFAAAFDQVFPEHYPRWETGDFVQLAKWRKAYPNVAPEQFVAVAQAIWAMGIYGGKVALTIKALCAGWSTAAAKVRQQQAPMEKNFDVDNPF